MTNRSIDRQIAELMGYNVRAAIGISDTWLVSKPGNTFEQLLPEFSTDWNAMRLLVEWLQSKSFMIITNQYPNDYGYTFCYIQKWNDDHGWETLAVEKEDTAPLALCCAVLSLPEGVLKSE